jgi:hypothetical protein
MKIIIDTKPNKLKSSPFSIYLVVLKYDAKVRPFLEISFSKTRSLHCNFIAIHFKTSNRKTFSTTLLKHVGDGKFHILGNDSLRKEQWK